MRRVSSKVIENTIYEALITATYKLPEDMKKVLKKAYEKETSPIGKIVLNQIVKNYELALSEKIPLCQDTGQIVLFVEMGQEVIFSEGFLLSAFNKAVTSVTSNGYMRASSLSDPLKRGHGVTNIPPIIHIDIVRGDRVKIYAMLKGAGAENTSTVMMLSPDADAEVIQKKVIDWVVKNASKACPPVIVGVGIGGDFEYSAIMSKKALIRKIGSNNKNELYAKMEKDILKEVNNSGIGPMGLGGDTTALAVNIEYSATHIASLPVAINLNCHSSRIVKIVI